MISAMSNNIRGQFGTPGDQHIIEHAQRRSLGQQSTKSINEASVRSMQYI